ncbi:MAG: nucleoside phosphorylase [Microbacterium sp. SCN 70-200]|uniref:phosphorylase family protein n=1 Tax=unclassified Microbacterium TaxID=2609290 RepID=UPI000868BC22|nr:MULTISPECIES: nucleoside phosphorylase [unclassified Microbacterium]MBN9215636.1 nucleoside phosphorylase [Microbacterium sp.]ODT41254.1 MAG: nucleoside phosphorylase [Microbacterium sp. SCN 70-200]OJV79350.1 MAG: nucleoside phosphorylase [Microbacterium sp. 70-16]
MKLLVAALASELVAFEDELDGFERLVTGPGKLQATYALTRRLDAGGIDEIVVVGTAGSLDSATTGLHEIAAAIQHDVTDIDGIAGQHVSLPAQVQTRGGTATIATGDHFVDDADAVASIRGLGATLVDMETYAYIWVAEQFGVPITVLKAVSDNAQDDAVTDWRETVAACSATLRDAMRERYGV